MYAAAVEAARSVGITLFAAAGNGGQAEALIAPACVSGVVAVGNVYNTDLSQFSWPGCSDSPAGADQVACSSNSSPALDLLAPGTLIRSTWLGGGQNTQSGTSMATPHVTAVAALMLQANPELTPAEIESALKETGLPVVDSRNGRTTPRIDALAAVAAVAGDLQPLPISGVVLLQGRADHSGSNIFLSQAPCPTATFDVPVATTDPAGQFEISLLAGQSYGCLQVSQPGYLPAQLQAPAGELGTVTLLAGDINGDNIVNILDLVRIARQFQSNDPAVDVDISGVVDVIDLSLTAQNFNKQGPIIWPDGE